VSVGDPRPPTVRRLEEAALSAWPALRQHLVDGAVLRVADGHTKRANSINPLYPSERSPARHRELAETAFAALGRPPLWRLTPLAPAGLGEVLDRAGYSVFEESVVETRALAPGDFAPDPAGAVLARATDAPPGTDGECWLDANIRLGGAPAGARATLAAMLDRVPPPAGFVALVEGGRIAATAMVAVQDRLAGLFEVVVDPAGRGRGLGARVVASAYAWAAEAEARHAYLQVTAANAAARRLYARLGFAESHRYHYRAPPG